MVTKVIAGSKTTTCARRTNAFNKYARSGHILLIDVALALQTLESIHSAQPSCASMEDVVR